MIDEADRGYLLGDGVFDTMRVEARRPLLFARHLVRLANSCASFGFGVSREALEQAIRTGTEELAGKTGSLRTTVTRGPGPRGLLPPAEPQPTIRTRAAPSGARASASASAIIANVRRNEGSPATSHKTLGYLDNILARQEAADQGAEEAIMLTNGGTVACTTIGNLIVLREEGPSWTPRAGGGVLPGVVRAVLTERGLLEERDLTPGDLHAAPLARSNSLIGIAPLHLKDAGDPPQWRAAALRRLTDALEEAEAQEL